MNSTRPALPDEPARRRALPLRLAGLAGLAQAACALEVDPYLVAKAGGLAGLEDLGAARVCAALLGLCALLAGTGVRAAAPALLATGLLALLVSTPTGSAAFHAAQALLLGAATFALASGAARTRPRAARLLLVALPLLLAEAAFATVAQSHAVGYTLAARLWFARHWSPPSNSLGFRDVEHAADTRRDLFVLGDSFVSGVGMADVSERFGERLAAELGDGWHVHNLGLNGTDTLEQREVLERHPFEPEALVLSYYVNDIAGAGRRAGAGWPRYRPYRDLGRAAWLVSRSYLLDYLYWLRPRDDLAAEGRFLAHCFERPEVVLRHEHELEELVAAARARSPTVVALIFPELLDPGASAAQLEPARRTFARLGVPVVEVAPLLADLAPGARVVNRNDAHPAALVHARVAQALAAELRRLGLQ